MSHAAKSVFYFGIYMIILGITLFTVPNMMLKPINMPETHEPWIRVGASLVAIVGWYYIVAARNELTPLIKATILGRHLVLVSFAILVFLDHFQWQLLLFTIPDQLGAVWTRIALKKDGASTPEGEAVQPHATLQGMHARSTADVTNEAQE